MTTTNPVIEETNRLRQQVGEQIRSNRLDAAQTTLEALVRHAPHDVPACLELADVMFKRGQIRASSGPLLQAVQHLPKHAPLIVQLVKNLIARGEIVAARRCLDFLVQAPTPPVNILLTQAHLRFMTGEFQLAKDAVERALEDGADDPDDHHLHAMLLQFTGDIDGACTVLEKCLERWPLYGDAVAVLVNLRKQKPQKNRLAFVEEQLQQLPAHGDDPSKKFVRAEFEYAHFKVLDDLDRADEAWPALARCNALMHELNPYDAEGEVAVTDTLIGTTGVIGQASSAATDFEGPVPIFIVGMPRTGSTLLDRMLSSHSQVATAGELIDFWRQMHWVADVRPAQAKGMCEVIRRSASIDFREVAARYLEQTRWRAHGRRYFIDKLPWNIQMVAFIRRAFPHAPILHMVRDPMDVCFSNFKAMFGNVSPYSYELEALAHYYRQYARVVAHWRTHLPGAMFDVPYADMVSNPQTTMRKVLAHCGLEVEEACLHPERNAAPVATPSSAQVREPIHTRGVGQWRRYAEPLQPLQQALADLL